jgi:hypothetical protein
MVLLVPIGNEEPRTPAAPRFGGYALLVRGWGEAIVGVGLYRVNDRRLMHGL